MTLHSIRDFGIGRGQIFVAGHWVDFGERRPKGDPQPQG